MAKGSKRQRKKTARRTSSRPAASTRPRRPSPPQSQKSKDIKRINERYAEILRAVRAGKIPQGIADRYAEAMRAAAGEHILPSGNISHSKAAEAAISQKDLDALLSRETASQARRHLDRQIEEEFGPGYTQEEREEYFNDMTFVSREISEHRAESYDALKAAFWGVPGLKSYTELAEAIRVYNGPGPRPSGEVPAPDIQRIMFT